MSIRAMEGSSCFLIEQHRELLLTRSQVEGLYVKGSDTKIARTTVGTGKYLYPNQVEYTPM